MLLKFKSTKTNETTPVPEQTHPGNLDFVILLHGLGRTRHSMNRIAEALSGAGFQVKNIGYPSARQDIHSLVCHHVAPAIKASLRQGASKIHVVSHSMGGILIRGYLQRNTLPQGSRIVMLSPPNHGSEVADFLKQFTLYRCLLGPAAQQLGSRNDDLPNMLKAIPGELGILAGNKSLEPWFAWLIPGPNDGKVSVESTKLPEMTDFRVIECGHTFIMQSPTAIRQILSFLRLGHFE